MKILKHFQSFLTLTPPTPMTQAPAAPTTDAVFNGAAIELNDLMQAYKAALDSIGIKIEEELSNITEKEYIKDEISAQAQTAIANYFNHFIQSMHNDGLFARMIREYVQSLDADNLLCLLSLDETVSKEIADIVIRDKLHITDRLEQYLLSSVSQALEDKLDSLSRESTAVVSAAATLMKCLPHDGVKELTRNYVEANADVAINSFVNQEQKLMHIERRVDDLCARQNDLSEFIKRIGDKLVELGSTTNRVTNSEELIIARIERTNQRIDTLAAAVQQQQDTAQDT